MLRNNTFFYEQEIKGIITLNSIALHLLPPGYVSFLQGGCHQTAARRFSVAPGQEA